jgi:NAD-dependent histone deacetylase SIR2
MNEGFAHSYEADLCLAMGSSLRVTPAANMPEAVGKNKKKGKNLVIVNL